MTTVATDSPPREVLLRVRLGLPAAQLLLLVVALVVARRWWTHDSPADADSSWTSWAPVLGALVALAVSAWTGWALLRLTWRSRQRWPHLVAVLAEAATLALLAPLAVVVPFAFAADLLYVPV